MDICSLTEKMLHLSLAFCCNCKIDFLVYFRTKLAVARTKMLKILCLLTNTVFLIVTCFYMSVMIKILNRNINYIKKEKS